MYHIALASIRCSRGKYLDSVFRRCGECECRFYQFLGERRIVRIRDRRSLRRGRGTENNRANSLLLLAVHGEGKVGHQRRDPMLGPPLRILPMNSSPPLLFLYVMLFTVASVGVDRAQCVVYCAVFVNDCCYCSPGFFFFFFFFFIIFFCMGFTVGLLICYLKILHLVHLILNRLLPFFVDLKIIIILKYQCHIFY